MPLPKQCFFVLFKFYHWIRNDFYKSKKIKTKMRGHPLIPHVVQCLLGMYPWLGDM